MKFYKRKYFKIITPIILISTFIFSYFSYKEVKSNEVSQKEMTYTANISDIKISFYGDGETKLLTENIDFQVNGEVEDIYTNAGLDIKEGDIIAKLNDDEYLDNVKTKQLEYDKSKMNYEDLMSDNLGDISSQIKNNELLLEKEKNNYDYKVIQLDNKIKQLEADINKINIEYNIMNESKDNYPLIDVENKERELELKQGELNIEKLNYDNNIESYNKIITDIEDKLNELHKNYDETKNKNSVEFKTAELDLLNKEKALETAKEELANTTLKSPIEGKVVFISKSKGEQVVTSGFKTDEAVKTTEHFAILQKNEAPTIVTTISEVDLVNVYMEQDVDVVFESIEDVIFSGNVTNILSLPNVDNSGIVSYDVTITLKEDDRLFQYKNEIKNNMTTNLEFILKQVNEVIIVPVDAVYFENGIQYVNVLKDDMAEKRKIVTGLTDGDKVEIKEGLNKGEKVVY